MKYLKGILLPALVGLASFVVAKDAPLVEAKDFDSELANIFFFDDSDVAILAEIETSKVWRSPDAGKTWEEQKGLRTLGIIKNPFDKNVAIALGDTKHWITYNQGEKWTEFETEEPFSLGNPLSFHASDNKKILFHGMEVCFGLCIGKVRVWIL